MFRARHLEVHVEHRSLGHPPLQDATLPYLTETKWAYFSEMKRLFRDFIVRRGVSDLENYYYELAALEGDYVIPSINTFIDGKTIPRARATPSDFTTPIAGSLAARVLDRVCYAGCAIPSLTTAKPGR